MGENTGSISIKTDFLQEALIEDVTSSSAPAVYPPAEKADGGIREPIPTKERNTSQLHLQ